MDFQSEFRPTVEFPECGLGRRDRPSEVALQADAADGGAMFLEKTRGFLEVVLVQGVHAACGEAGIVVEEKHGIGIDGTRLFEPVRHDFVAEHAHQVIVGEGFVDHIPIVETAAGEFDHFRNPVGCCLSEALRIDFESADAFGGSGTPRSIRFAAGIVLARSRQRVGFPVRPVVQHLDTAYFDGLRTETRAQADQRFSGIKGVTAGEWKTNLTPRVAGTDCQVNGFRMLFIGGFEDEGGQPLAGFVEASG
jgi:hypothetical protein